MLTARAVLQMGHDCGIEDVEAVYSMIMCHYDGFFRIAFIEHDISEFLWMLKEAGFISFYMGVGTWAEGTIVEHANRLGIILEEIDWSTINDPYAEPFNEPEGVCFDLP
jgi:hypothetical protein